MVSSLANRSHHLPELAVIPVAAGVVSYHWRQRGCDGQKLLQRFSGECRYILDCSIEVIYVGLVMEVVM